MVRTTEQIANDSCIAQTRAMFAGMAKADRVLVSQIRAFVNRWSKYFWSQIPAATVDQLINNIGKAYEQTAVIEAGAGRIAREYISHISKGKLTANPAWLKEQADYAAAVDAAGLRADLDTIRLILNRRWINGTIDPLETLQECRAIFGMTDHLLSVYDKAVASTKNLMPIKRNKRLDEIMDAATAREFAV